MVMVFRPGPVDPNDQYQDCLDSLPTPPTPVAIACQTNWPLTTIRSL